MAGRSRAVDFSPNTALCASCAEGVVLLTGCRSELVKTSSTNHCSWGGDTFFTSILLSPTGIFILVIIQWKCGFQNVPRCPRNLITQFLIKWRQLEVWTPVAAVKISAGVLFFLDSNPASLGDGVKELNGALCRNKLAVFWEGFWV